MSVLSSPEFLRKVLFADAASCLATGAAQLLFAEPLAGAFRLPVPLLVGTGAFLLAYAALVATVATRPSVPRALIGFFVAGNFAWAAGCAALLVGAWVAPTALGAAWIAAQAVTVVVLAELQWMCLKRTRVAGWA